MENSMYLTISIIVLIAIVCLIVFHWRKKKIICKICCMSDMHKCRLLNELVEPLGYNYYSKQDIFSSRLDAWQKDFGYGAIYDRGAPYFNMVFDSYPVYFDHDGKTWLIEFWKGQYGIDTGSEVGIYHTDHIIPPAARKLTIFHAASNEEMPEITMRLRRRGCPIAALQKEHWWLTIFSMGLFSRPKELSVDITLRFHDLSMRDAFLDALLASGHDPDDIDVMYTSVSFTFHAGSQHWFFLKRWYCHYVQFKNRIFCKLFCFVTRPFEDSGSKLLYLYYYIPFVFRRIFRLRRFGRKGKHHKKH